MKLQGATPSELKEIINIPELTESKILQILRLLRRDSAELVHEAGIDKKTQQGLYAINWRIGFKSVKATLLEQIIKNTYSDHHSRVVRVLRTCGLQEEKDLVRMCVLPPQNMRSIINRLISDGLVTMVKREGTTSDDAPRLYNVHTA